jgi:hypothetical protein
MPKLTFALQHGFGGDHIRVEVAVKAVAKRGNVARLRL